jgi:hypothetical protein
VQKCKSAYGLCESAKVEARVQSTDYGVRSTEYRVQSTEYGGMAGGRRLHGERTRRSRAPTRGKEAKGAGDRLRGRCKSANRPMACAKVQKWRPKYRVRITEYGVRRDGRRSEVARRTDATQSRPYPMQGGKGEAGTGKLVGGRRRKHNPLSPGRFALLLHHHEVGPAVEERLLTCVRQDGDEKQKSDATAALKHQ